MISRAAEALLSSAATYAGIVVWQRFVARRAERPTRSKNDLQETGGKVSGTEWTAEVVQRTTDLPQDLPKLMRGANFRLLRVGFELFHDDGALALTGHDESGGAQNVQSLLQRGTNVALNDIRGAKSGEPLHPAVYTTAWQQVRKVGLSPEQQAWPFAADPYSLRHAAVSTWLAAGLSPVEVAERAGHSVAVLLKVYAAVLDGQQETSNQKIGDLLGDD